MKITAPREKLAAALAAANRAIPSRPTNPTYAACVLQVVITDGAAVLVVTGGDGENWVRTRISCTADEAGIAAVPAAPLAELIKDLPGDQAELTISDEKIHIALKKGSYSLPRYPDVPAFAVVEDTVIGTVEASDLADAISKTTIAAAKSEATPVLTGVRLEVSGESLTLVATDRYRLATRTIGFAPAASEDSDEAEAAFDAIIAVRQLADVAKLLGKSGTVTISEGQGNVAFATESTAVHIRVLGGEYPAWRNLLKNQPTSWVEVSLEDLVAPVRRTGRISEDVITLTIATDTVTVAGEAAEAGAGSEEIAASVTPEVDGDPMVIRFNPAVLLEGLSTMDVDTVKIGITDPTKSVLVTAGDDHTYLAMPRR